MRDRLHAGAYRSVAANESQRKRRDHSIAFEHHSDASGHRFALLVSFTTADVPDPFLHIDGINRSVSVELFGGSFVDFGILVGLVH